GLAPPARVFEFGAGDGELTLALAEAAGAVIAIEVDRGLHTLLSERIASFAHVSAVHGDFREASLPATGDYHVVANLPFSLTAATMRLLTCQSNPPASAHLVLQREAAAVWTGSGPATRASVLAGLRFTFDVPLALRRR